MSDGACRCGAVRFTAQGAPLLTMACHCRGCQQMTGSAFSLSSLYAADQFAVTSGAPVRGGVGTGPSHMTCTDCKSWLFTVPEGMEQFVNVRSALFEDAAAHRPFIEAHRGEALGWAETGALKSYETVPGDDEFGELIAAYGTWDGRVQQ